ncbi:MAG: HAD family hydrolase [Lentisphaerota bacterium]
MINKSKACFLDRDGVLIEEKIYLASISDVYIFPETYDALKLLKDDGFKIIVVTNQAGVAKGYYDESTIPMIHEEIDRQLALAGVGVDAYYYCPHHPKGKVQEYAIKCDCRKPAPGMILQAVNNFDIDLAKSFLIGDKMSDIGVAENAGCLGILVKTGHGKEHITKAQDAGIIVKENILEAVKYFLERNNQ